MNVAGLSSSHIMLNHIVQTIQPWLVFITETHIVEAEAFEQFGIPGFTAISCLSNSRHTGGVTIFIKESITYKILINEARDGNWFLSISATISKKSFIFSLVYHSPSSSNAHFVNLLEWWFDKFLDLGEDNILIGDFNINWLNSAENYLQYY